MRGEVAAGPGVHRHDERRPDRQRPHRVRLGLLLERDREHPLVDAGLRPAMAATIAVEPPTEPAVCTRSSGLPAAPSASARNSSGIITPSNRSGALPTTTASMSAKRQLGVGQRAVDRLAAAARPSTRRSRLARWCVWPMPSTAAACSSSVPPSRRRGSAAARARWWRARAPVCASPDHTRLAASPIRFSPAVNIGLRGERSARRVDPDVVAQPERGAQDQLLVGERGVQLGDVDARRPTPRRRPPRCSTETVRSRAPMSAIGSMRCAMPVIQAGRSARLAGPSAGGEHDGGGAVGRPARSRARGADRRTSAGRAASSAVVSPLRIAALVAGRRPPSERAATSAIAFSSQSPASSPSRACSAARRHGVRPQRRHHVRVELQRQRPAQDARRGLAEPVDQRGVDLAGLDLHPRLVERPGGVHLDVRLA